MNNKLEKRFNELSEEHQALMSSKARRNTSYGSGEFVDDELFTSWKVKVQQRGHPLLKPSSDKVWVGVHVIEKLAAGIISSVKGCGGFRESSPNFVGSDAIADLSAALRPEGVVLGDDGSMSPVALDSLSGRNLSQALRGYVNRAKKGIEDAALVVGTSKDLMEAVAAHVIQELWGSYPSMANFPSLLGQAFVALEMATPEKAPAQGEHQRCRLERSLYETACSINNLRNKQGTGHGRPWVPDLKAAEAKAAVEFIGTISELMLDNLERKKP